MIVSKNISFVNREKTKIDEKEKALQKIVKVENAKVAQKIAREAQKIAREAQKIAREARKIGRNAEIRKDAQNVRRKILNTF